MKITYPTSRKSRRATGYHKHLRKDGKRRANKSTRRALHNAADAQFMHTHESPQGQAPGQNARGSNDPSTHSADSHRPIASEQIVVGRKKFFIDLKENPRGRFLKITEDVGGRRDTIMLPIEGQEGAREFIAAVTRILEFESTL